MKILQLVVFLFLLGEVSGQNLPFSITNFIALPGTVLDTPDYEGDDPRYLSADRSNPLSTKGFNLNMAGTTRTDLDMDVPLHSETSSSSTFILSFSGAASLTFTKNMGFEYAAMNYSFTPNPGIPVNVKVLDEDGEEHSFNLPQGNIGSARFIGDTINGEIDTSAHAPYLMGILVKPELNRTLVRLIFHNRVQFNIAASQITGTEMHFYIEKPYPQISSMGISITNIASPVSVYNYTPLTMIPAVNAFVVNSGYAGDAFMITGTNLTYLEQVSFAGEDVVYQIIDNNTMSVILPNTPATAPFVLKGDHGMVTTTNFSVSIKPECNAIPVAASPFFYSDAPQSLATVFKWDYSGNPSSVFEVRYRNDPGDEWTVQDVSTAHEFVLASVAPFTTYSFEVRAACPNGLYSEWSETGVVKIEYTDMIEVSKNLNKALIVWMNDSIDPHPMDTFLHDFSDPVTGTLDPRETSGFIGRFFQTMPVLYRSQSDVPTTASVSCICNVVTVDLAQVYEAKRDNTFDYGKEHLQNNYQVGFKFSKFRYIGAAQRNRSGCMDYDTRNSGKQARRHTNSDNSNEIYYGNGDTPYTDPQSHATLRMAYLCANPDMTPSVCSCDKKVYISAEIKADICATVPKKECKGHAKKSYGGAAECGFGGIILTGVDYGDPVKTVQNMQIIAAGHHNVFKTYNYDRSWNATFVQKGISLLFNTTLAVLTAGSTDVVQNLINQGYMAKAVNDLTAVLTTNPYNVTFEEAGASGCNSYSIITPSDPFFITLRPNEERFVNMATVSYSRVRGWGCYYEATADMQTSYHLAAATDRYDIAHYSSCCINPTATYATRSVDGDFNPQRGGIGHQDRIKTFLYNHGDRNGSAPIWFDPDNNQASADDITSEVFVWDASPVINRGLPAGRLRGNENPCKPELLHDMMIRLGGDGGGTLAPVALGWTPSISVYRTGYFIEKGYDLSSMTTLNSTAIPRDSLGYVDTVDTHFDTVYYRIYAVNANNHTQSDYSSLLAIPLSSGLRKTATTGMNESAEHMPSINLLTHPNPSSGLTYFTYTLPEETAVNLSIFDMNGRKVKELVGNERQARGVYILPTDVQSFSPGQYIVLLRTDKDALYKHFVKE